MVVNLYVTTVDLLKLEIRKVIIQPKSWRAVVYFRHPSITNRAAFSASITFHIKDNDKWYTSFDINSTKDVIVGEEAKLELKEQLNLILAPYFSSLWSKESPW
jgi:hypothetical protein